MSTEASPRNGHSRSSSLRRSGRSTNGRRTPVKSEDVVHKKETKVDSRSDQARLKTLLENLEIKFTNCKFTYEESHFKDQPSNKTSKKRSRLATLRDTIFNSVDKIAESITCEETFNNCLFVPIEDKTKVKDFIRLNFANIRISFIDCKFKGRSSTVTEKLVRKLRSVFGIPFELEYITSTVIINGSTFRMKDILVVNHIIQERIVNEA